MATLGTMKTRIANEIARSDLTSEIALAITSAIAFYEGDRFWFNELTAFFTSIPGQDTYSASNASYLSDLVEHDGMTMTIDTARYRIEQITFDEFVQRRTSVAPTSDPTHFAYYLQSLYLWPMPNAVRTFTVFYAGALPALANDSSRNAWTTEAEELIRLHAKADLFDNLIRDFGEADRIKAREQAVLLQLRTRTTKQTAAGRIVAEYL